MKFNTCFGGFAGISMAVVLTTTTALANEVRLKSPDGQIDMIGQLINVSATDYTIMTRVGQLSVARNLVDCEGDSCPQVNIAQADLTIRGSDTVGEELMPLLVEGYANRWQASVANRETVSADTVQLSVNEDFGQGDRMMLVSVQSAGSSTGLSALIEGQTNIAMSSRSARSSEIRALAGQGRGNLTDLTQEYVVAVDSILVVVSPSNPVTDLTMEQVGRIFGGQITNWSELGGPNLPINVYTRPETSGTRGVFEGQTVRAQNLSMSPSATVVGSNEEMSNSVTEDPSGIGYVGFASVRNAKPVDLTLNCGIKTQATEFAAKTEEYPLERRLRLYVDNGPRSPEMQELLDYSISSEADGLIRKAGFIDLSVKVDDSGLDAARLTEAAAAANDIVALQTLRNMLVDLNEAIRLSTTFRFESGSARLDNKAQRDIVRVIEFLSKPEYRNREVILVGFTDADGDFSANESLSRARASVALEAIQNHPDGGKLAGLNIRTAGYGELSPVGCNDTFQGRQRNRRVEVWVR